VIAVSVSREAYYAAARTARASGARPCRTSATAGPLARLRGPGESLSGRHPEHRRLGGGTIVDIAHAIVSCVVCSDRRDVPRGGRASWIISRRRFAQVLARSAAKG
jgi:hypothetical protein